MENDKSFIKYYNHTTMTTIFNIITCPVCGGELRRENRSLVCASGHTFDIAKSGYVNMLPPGKEKNARTGDEKDMVRARVDFLAKGYYAGISSAVAEIMAEYTSGDAVLCDMGCGEGYHTCRFAGELHDKTGHSVLALGFDASKYAAECASKLAKSKGWLSRDGIGAELYSPVSCAFMPGNIFHLPVKDHAVTCAVSMFAPVAGDEARRILTDDGILVVVSSGRNHLIEMRRLIYDDVHLSDSLPDTPDGFELADRRNLTYTASIENKADIASLFVMTPFYYKTTEAGRARLAERETLDVTVDVNLSVFKVKL
ncbi:MAG: methyltransferase domain-containing protein [Clostridia bacterium]|nr:methyltransferase domain-containing protein [Clostridia bacterium]